MPQHKAKHYHLPCNTTHHITHSLLAQCLPITYHPPQTGVHRTSPCRYTTHTPHTQCLPTRSPTTHRRPSHSTHHNTHTTRTQCPPTTYLTPLSITHNPLYTIHIKPTPHPLSKPPLHITPTALNSQHPPTEQNTSYTGHLCASPTHHLDLLPCRTFTTRVPMRLCLIVGLLLASSPAVTRQCVWCSIAAPIMRLLTLAATRHYKLSLSPCTCEAVRQV